jgi:DNA-directed RNA polymerase subunit E'/Rpb7
MIKQIDQRVSIEFKYLDSNINCHILNKLKKNMTGACSLKNGYIIEVTKIVKLGDNQIGCANSLVIFNVRYEAEILKPEKDDIFSGKVCMIFQDGIFVDVKGKMKVLIPISMISYVYNKQENIFESPDHTIIQGMEVNIKIIMTKYEKKQFHCIGKLLDKM